MDEVEQLPDFEDELLMPDIDSQDEEEEEDMREKVVPVINFPHEVLDDDPCIAYKSNILNLANMTPPTTCDRDGCSGAIKLQSKGLGTALVLSWVRKYCE